MEKNIKDILIRSQHEIVSLRKSNETMSIRLEMFDDLMTLLHTKAASKSRTMSHDIVAEIKKALAEQAALKAVEK